MTLLFDLDVFNEREGRNKAFQRKIFAAAIEAIIGTSLPYALYGFQENSGAGLTADNEEGTAAADMILSNAGMWSGAGWYVPPASKALGLGLQNDGGVSGYVGTVPDVPNINMDGESFATWIFVFNARGTGEGGFGRLIEKGSAYRTYFQAANEIRHGIYNGVWRSVRTGPNVAYDHWNCLVIVYDGTQAVNSDRLKMYLNGRDVSTTHSPDIPATISDVGNPLYFLDNSGNLRACDGRLGCAALIPGYAMSLAQAQSLVELRAVFQPPVVNQPGIIANGMFGGPVYNLDGAAHPNSDHLYTYQVEPLKTTSGTLIMGFTHDDLTVDSTLFSLSTDGVDADEFQMRLAGTEANDPLCIFQRTAGIATWRANFPGGLISGPFNIFAITSNGVITRGFFNLNEIILTDLIGANAGQWFGLSNNADVFSIGVRRIVVLDRPFNGRVWFLKIYDEPLSPLQLQQIINKKITPQGPRWYPDH